jgi:hypothetical protein
MDSIQALEKHFGKSLDKHERLVAEALVSVGVLLNPANQDFELVAIGPIPAHVHEGYTRRGLQYSATLGVTREFKPRIELAVPIAPVTIAVIMAEFTWFVQRAVSMCEESVSVERLYRLWNLKDERPN